MFEKAVKTYKRSFITISIITGCVFLLMKCTGNPDKPSLEKNVANSQFAGSATCANCHKDIYEKHIHTAHFLTSQIATEHNIKGSFEQGKNEFDFGGDTKVVMEKRADGLYQVAYENGVEKKARPFSIVVGSGTKGQTYLYWFKNNLGQLPISYFTHAAQWSNSPGYGNKLVFNRPVTSRCLECHSTFAQVVSAQNVEPEQFDHNQIIYGVDCEKCHGPAQQHVDFQTKNPTIKTAKYIIAPTTFTRKQSLDMCAVCHGGRLSKTKPSFSFKAGDDLADYFAIDTAAKDANDIDVHGNQLGLLAASKCFKNSQMTCLSCHNPHENEAGKLALFSQRCITCHGGGNDKNNGHEKICKLTASIGPAIKNNCIDCHAPEQPSKAIAMLLQGNEMPTSATMRSHFIKIYPEATKRFLSGLKLKNR
jgi:mono/diheme cytochrome c family protein